MTPFVGAAASLIMAVSGLMGCNGPSPRPEASTIAFCGVHPGDPTALKAAKNMHNVAGIDVTMGPCVEAGPDYTQAFPGQRYLDRGAYAHLVLINAQAGMQTIVYDAGIWSQDPVERAAVIDFWSGNLGDGTRYIDHIFAWDMGDEFDDATPMWDILVDRWNFMVDVVTAETGVGPFTNHLPWAATAAFRDLKKSNVLFSFDQYYGDKGVQFARDLDSQVYNLVCAVNALKHGDFKPTSKLITNTMHELRDAGCDWFLIFGGHVPYHAGFGTSSLVNNAGQATAWAKAVAQGSK